MKSRKPRKCLRGRRKSDGKCKRKPGPKRSRKTKKSGKKPKSDVSYKISKLMKEGYPQKQAVAIALKMKEQGRLGPRGGYKSKKKKPVKKSKRCLRGRRKSDGKCKRKSGPKRSRKLKFKIGGDSPLYNNNDPNIDNIRQQAKDLFINNGVLLAQGTYSKIYKNSTQPKWILRCTLVNKTDIPDEISITKGMLNRQGKRKNLTDIWIEQSSDPYKGKLFSITRKFDGDGGAFLNSELVNNSDIMQTFYKLLLDDFNYLNSNGWLCFDLKPGNILINEPDPSRDDWVRLTDFGADWCKQNTVLDDVIPRKYQPLFMLFLFQFNSTLHIPLQKQEAARIELLKFFFKNIFELPDPEKEKLIKAFQKIYNFFLYLLITPYDLIEDKYKPIQINLLHYTCKHKQYPFDQNIDQCKTIGIIKSYFIPINTMSNDKLNMQDLIFDYYRKIVNYSKVEWMKNNKLNPYTLYVQVITPNLSQIKQALNIV